MVHNRLRVKGLTRRFLWILIAGAAISAWTPAWSQDTKTTLVEPPVPLLPHEVGNWLLQPDAATAPANTDSKDDTVLAEAGLKREERGIYREGNAGPAVTVIARQFVDATGAHAAYSYGLKPGSEYRGMGLGDETNLKANRYLFRSGTSVVEAEGAKGSKTEALLSALQSRLPKVGGPKGIAPLLPTLLPQKALEQDSVKYALGPVSYEAMGGVLPGGLVGFDKAAEAVTAKYAGKGELTMLLYPTPEIAGEKLRAIEKEVRDHGASDGTVVLRRTGTLVLMTTGKWTQGEAKELVQGIHPRMDVTWNKALPQIEFHTEIRKTYGLLTSIAIFCGFGALAAIVLGVSLGAGRAAIRVLQGKPAATEPEFLRIDLSGRAAPIHLDGPGAGS
jgi:hypothetical protein